MTVCQPLLFSPVDGWTIAFQANGPQGAWTTLWTGVGGPKRQPAHCPDHRDCPHPRAFAHAPHRAKGVTGSPFGFVLGEGLVSQGGQIDLDAPEPYGFGSRYRSIDRLEHSPASPLAFQHAGFCLPPELDEVEVVAGTHRGGHNQGFREAPLIKGVASENGKNRTVSNWHGPASRKRSFVRGFNENQIRASAGMACCFFENYSRIARLKQPSFENHENAVSRGGLAQSRAVVGYRIS